MSPDNCLKCGFPNPLSSWSPYCPDCFVNHEIAKTSAGRLLSVAIVASFLFLGGCATGDIQFEDPVFHPHFQSTWQDVVVNQHPMRDAQ